MILWLYEKFRHHCIFLISLIFCNSDEDLFIIQSCSSYFNGFSHSHRLLYILIIRTSTRSADKQVHRRRGGFGVLHSRIRLGVHRPSVRVSVCLSICPCCMSSVLLDIGQQYAILLWWSFLIVRLRYEWGMENSGPRIDVFILWYLSLLLLGEILSVMQELPFGERSAKHILFHIFKQIVNYKKQDSTKGEVRCIHISGLILISFSSMSWNSKYWS